MLSATDLSFLLVGVLATKNGLPDAPSETSLLCDLLSRLFEIVHDRPADCSVSLCFCGLLLVRRELRGVLLCKRWIELFAVSLFFHELRLESTVH